MLRPLDGHCLWRGWGDRAARSAQGGRWWRRRALQPRAQAPTNATSAHGHLGSAFIEKVASLSWPSQVLPFSRVRCACLLAQMMSPVEKIHDSKCVLLKESDVGKLGNKANVVSVALAEKMMDEARSIVSQFADLDAATKAALLGEHDIRIIYHLAKKGKASRLAADHPSLEAVGQTFLDALFKVTGQRLENPWAKGDAATSSKGKGNDDTKGDNDKGDGDKGEEDQDGGMDDGDQARSSHEHAAAAHPRIRPTRPPSPSPPSPAPLAREGEEGSVG